MALSPDIFAGTYSVGTPVFTRDSTSLFYLSGAGLARLWRQDLESGERTCLAAPDEQIAIVRRSPVDDTLILGLDTGGDERQQLLLLNPGTGQLAPLTQNPPVIHDFGGWSPDGTRIVFAANERDEAHFDIHELELLSGSRRTIFRGEGIVTVVGYNRDGTKVAALHDRAYGDMDLLILDLTGTAPVSVFPRPSGTNYASVRWSGDGTALLALTDHGGQEHMRLCRLDPVTGDVTVVHEAPGRDVEGWSISPDGQILATIENDGGWSVLRIGPIAEERQPNHAVPRGVIDGLTFSPDGTSIAFTVQGPQSPPALWIYQQGQAWPIFTPEQPVNPSELVNFAQVAWESFDGRDVRGWMALPPGPVPPSGHPAVIWVHGGPVGEARPNFRPDLQMLLRQGLAVLMPNVRGSSGRGRSWAESDDIEKRPDAVQDLMYGRHFLGKHSSIDSTRIGLLGQSYGGYMVNAAVTEYPDQWKACANYYGIVDFMTTLAGTGPWRRGHRAAEYGDPVRDAALLTRLSPIHRAGDIQVPMFVAHGHRDPRVPFSESEQLVTALLKHQKPVTFLKFERAGHGFIRREDKTRVYQGVAAFFAEHL